MRNFINLLFNEREFYGEKDQKIHENFYFYFKSYYDRINVR